MEQNPEFCVGVQILLSRMESNPEEFETMFGKWHSILTQVVTAKQAGSDKLQQPNHLSGLTAAEINALYAGYSKFLRKTFDDAVMEKLLDDAEELSYSVTSAPTVLGTPSWGNPTLMTSNVSLTATLNQQHQAHVNKHTMALHTLGLKETV